MRTHQSALYRQVHEAVLIMKNEPITLNSRGEYHRVTVMMGDKEQEEKEERNKDEEESDEYLEVEDDHKRSRKRRKIGYN